MRLLRIICLLAFLLPAVCARSQHAAIDVGSFNQYLEVDDVLLHLNAEQRYIDLNNLNLDDFESSPPTIRENNFNDERWFLLSLYFDGPEEKTTIYFYPGKMVPVEIYRFDSSRGWQAISQREAFRAISITSSISLTPMQLTAGRTHHFLIKPSLHYYNWNEWGPIIAQKTAINDLILREFIQPNYTYSILTILMAGMMFMLLSYSFLKYYLNRRVAYLDNSLFGLTFLCFFSVIFINNFYYQPWWHRFSPFLQNWLQVAGYIFNFFFIVRFLNLRSTRPDIFRLLKVAIIVLVVYFGVLPFISFSDRLYPFNNVLFTIVGLLLVVVGLYVAVALHKWRKLHSRYVAFGVFSLLFFLSVIAILNIFFKEQLYRLQAFGGQVVLYNAGILASMFFYRLGLGQKERGEEMQQLQDIKKLQLENEKKELEKVLAIASSRVDERNRIAKEIHDDIGSGLTSIRLLSEIALVKEQNREELKKISANANELVNNLNEIIWSINSKNDTLPNLLAYIRSHMVDYLEPYNIKLSINIPPNIPAIEISGEKRRNIFMVVKECFTNIIKHANASAVNFTVQVRDELIFTIKDNGRGFNSKDVLPFKNGIRNMRERIEHVGGVMEIWGKNGTTITIRIPLNGNTHL